MQFSVSGMSCAACSARVEKAVAAVKGVDAVSVNLLTASMSVEGSAKPELICEAVRRAGYQAALLTKGASVSNGNSLKNDLCRLLISLALLLPTMYLSMGHEMLGLPLPGFLASDRLLRGILCLLLCLSVMIVNRHYFTGGFRAVKNGAPNMDTLVALGASSSFLFSVVCLFFPNAESGAELYFESAAMILTLISIGKLMESYSKGRTTDALKSLEKLAPTTAYLLEDGEEKLVSVSELAVGSIFAVHPGEIIPVDALILKGYCSVNEAALTGESLPVDKKAGDEVSAATVNQNGYLECRALRVGPDTAYSGIIRLVNEAAASKAPIARTADKAAGIFVPAVLGIALLTLTVWLILGKSLGYSLSRAISVLVISCPCSLGLATPVAVMVANGIGARNQILFKNAAALEGLGRVRTCVFDKTGTLSIGRPQITAVMPAEGISRQTLLRAAVEVEQNSTHPLALAVLDYAKEIKAEKVQSFTEYPGLGVEAKKADGSILRGGNAEFAQNVPSACLEAVRSSGKTAVYFTQNKLYLGCLLLSDEAKPDADSALAYLKQLKIKSIILSGDSEAAVKAFAEQHKIGQFNGSVRPSDKESIVRDLQNIAPVAMVGDGINDAPALTRAEVGIAVGTGTDVAIDAADVIILKDSLMDVPAAFKLSRKTMTVIRENLFWAFFYNALCIPLAAGVFEKSFGFSLNPMIAAACMSLSSFCVVMNALRLNFIRLYPRSKKTKEKMVMEKTLFVEGMMCHHCEAHVKKALEALPFVDSAEADYTSGKVMLHINAAFDEAAAKAAIEAEDYVYLRAE